MLGVESRQVVFALAGSLVAALALVGVADADHHPSNFPEMSYPYTEDKDGNCVNDPIDPINFAFQGDQGGLPNSVDLLERHVGWMNNSGSHQNLRVNVDGPGYDCRDQGNQRADDCGICERFHTRLWVIPSSLGTNYKRTVGDAHHEWVVYCGHAVDPVGYYYEFGSGFDWARTGVLNPEFENAGHNTWYESWGNSRTFKQCNPWYAGSSGAGLWIGAAHAH